MNEFNLSNWVSCLFLLFLVSEVSLLYVSVIHLALIKYIKVHIWYLHLILCLSPHLVLLLITSTIPGFLYLSTLDYCNLIRPGKSSDFISSTKSRSLLLQCLVLCVSLSDITVCFSCSCITTNIIFPLGTLSAITLALSGFQRDVKRILLR